MYRLPDDINVFGILLVSLTFEIELRTSAGFSSPNKKGKFSPNRESALAKLAGAGLFSDILNFN